MAPDEPGPAPPEMVVTEVRPQQRDPDRVSVFVNGQFAAGMPAYLAARHGLFAGQRIQPANLQAALDAEETHQAVLSIERLLAFRDRSETELRQRLHRQGFVAPVIEAAVEDARHRGLVDDARFASEWVRQRSELRPRSRSLVSWELRSKGLDAEAAQDALEEWSPDQEMAAAKAVAQKRLDRSTDPDPAAARRKVVALLRRRGFAWDVIRQALAESAEGEADAGEEEA